MFLFTAVISVWTAIDYAILGKYWFANRYLYENATAILMENNVQHSTLNITAHPGRSWLFTTYTDV